MDLTLKFGCVIYSLFDYFVYSVRKNMSAVFIVGLIEVLLNIIESSEVAVMVKLNRTE